MSLGEDLVNTKKLSIIDVEQKSIASKLGIKKGDSLLSINKQKIKDILEYKYVTTVESIRLEILRENGDIEFFNIVKEYDKDIGIKFDGIIDKIKSCHNNCIFCFIDQLPQNMREPLYIKDDDYRLSFLQGNFITLTNLKDEDIDRIIKYRISPINISVHATDIDTRVRMLRNKNAGKLLEYMKRLKEANIEMKAQIVLCPDINDGEILERTIHELEFFYPQLQCVAIVPVGLTKFRQGLYDLKSFDNNSAGCVIDQISNLQKKYIDKIDTRFVFLSDEFYVISNNILPHYEEYEGFPQLENGIGLISLFINECRNNIRDINKDIIFKNLKLTVATGEYANKFIQQVVNELEVKLKQKINVEIVAIKNNFFGESIKVAGLLTGHDIISQLKGKNSGEYLMICESMLKDGEQVFLDNISVSHIEKELNTKVVICSEDGSDFIKNIIDLLRIDKE